MLPRRNPLDEDERLTLQKARRMLRSGPSLAPTLAGQASATTGGVMDEDGVFHATGLTNITPTGEFYTAKG